MLNTDTMPKGISGRNRRLLTLLHRSFAAPFSVQEAAAALRFAVPRTQRFLAYLAERGWLVRVHRGLYAPVPLDAEAPSEWKEDPWVVAAKLFGPSYYIGGWTACEHWDLTEQIFRETVVFTTRRVRSKEVVIHGYPFRIRRTPPKNMFGTRPVWRDQVRMALSDPSRTVVDVLNNPSLGGGIRHVAAVVAEYFISDHRDDALLEDYLRRVDNHAVHKRLGYCLETLEVEAPGLLRACEEGVSSGVSLLDPSLPNRGPVRRCWNLRVNGTVPADGLSI